MTDIILTPLENDILLQKCETFLQEYKEIAGIQQPLPCKPYTLHNALLNILKDNNINISVKEETSTQSLYGTYYISSIDDPVSTHRSKFIIHRPDIFYLAEFADKQQLDRFANMLGFTYTQVAIHPYADQKNNMYREYTIDKTIYDRHLFNSKTEIPEQAKPFLAKSNGQIVTCYFVTNKHTIEIYRPNPNSADVYDPISAEAAIAFTNEYGSY